MPQARRPRGFKGWNPVVIGIISLCLIGGVLIFAPESVRAWIAGVLAAILTGYLANVLPGWINRANTSQQSPIVVTSKILDVDYVVTGGPNGRDVYVPASGHVIRLSVEAADTRTVLLQSLRPKVLSRGEASGQLAPHLGVVTPRPFDVLLDENPPRLRPVDPAAPGFPFKVAPGDPEVFDLRAFLSNGDVRWELELQWMCLGREGTTKIDLGGSPFRTMARPGTAVPAAMN
jgi:hypothetical protein